MSYVIIGHRRPLVNFNFAHKIGIIDTISAIGGCLGKTFAQDLMCNQIPQITDQRYSTGMEYFLDPAALARKVVDLAFENDSFAAMYADPTLDEDTITIQKVPILFTHEGVVRLNGENKNPPESDRIPTIETPPHHPRGVDDKGIVSDPDRVKTVVLLLGDQALPTAVAVEFAQQASVKDRRRHS